VLIGDIPRLGVISDARRRQTRRRLAAASLAIVALGAFALAGGPGAPPRPPLRRSSSLRYLAGPLAAHTALRLIALENTGRPYLVSVDRGTAVPVSGMTLPAPVTPVGTSVYPLVAHGAGALAFVTVPSCARCASTLTEYRIDAVGHARRVWALSLGYRQTFVPAPGSTAVWVSRWPHAAPCSLALEPGSHAAVRVPCGALQAVTSAGAWIGNGDIEMLVDPATGGERLRLRTSSAVSPIRGSLALESPASSAGGLALVDVLTGARRTLPWPSTLRFGVEAIPQPGGRLVALRFGEPFYPPSQAVDVWVLDTRDGALTHVPGFPALELLKFSWVSWAADGRLVIASKGAGRTVVGVWRPGERVTRVRRVPPIEGYSSFVALTPRRAAARAAPPPPPSTAAR